MDPLSITASVLTLVAAAGHSCKFVSSLVKNVSNAPDDIKRQRSAIDALSTTFGRLGALLVTLPASVQINPEFAQNLHSFINEVEEIERLANDASRLVNRSRVGGARARVKWAIGGEKRWQDFIKNMALWNTVFSNELQTIQITMIQTLMERDVKSVADTDEAAECQSDSKLAVPSPVKILHCYEQPVGVQVFESYKIGLNLFSGTLTRGLVISRQLSKDCRQTYQVLLASMACQLSITFRITRAISFKITLMVFSYRKPTEHTGLNVSLNLAFSSVVPDDWPSFLAVKTGDVRALKRILIDGQAKITDVTAQGDTLLHVATQHGMQEMVRMLIELGSEVNQTNDQGVTPLHLAAKKVQDGPIATLLLKSGADINRIDYVGRTPLHNFFHDSIRSILLNSELGISADNKDKRGMTIAHYVTWSSSSTLQDFESVLTATYVPITENDDDGRSFLHLAAQRGNLAIMKHLLAHPRQPELTGPDNYGRTPVHYATESSRAVEAVDLLLGRYGLSVHAKDMDGFSPLHHAAARDKVSALRKLLEYGADADLSLADSQGRTPLQVASDWRADASVRFLASITNQQPQLGGQRLSQSQFGKPKRRRLVHWQSHFRSMPRLVKPGRVREIIKIGFPAVLFMGVYLMYLVLSS